MAVVSIREVVRMATTVNWGTSSDGASLWIRRKAADATFVSRSLATQSQFCNQGPVTLHILFLEVPEQSPPLTDHHEQTSPAVMILFMGLQMLGEVVDALSQQRNLDLRGTGVRGVRAVFIYNSLSVFHEVLSYASKRSGDCPTGA